MPVKVVKRKGKFRVVESESGRIAKTDKGTSRDGGGHRNKTKASRQASAINAAWSRKSKKR